jgi:CRP-like cAMP-binding protein
VMPQQTPETPETNVSERRVGPLSHYLTQPSVLDLGKKGEMVYQETADAVYYVASGIVRLYNQLPSGKRASTGIRAEGEYFGIECCSAAIPEWAESLSHRASVLRWTREEVNRAIFTAPMAMVAFTRLLIARNCDYAQRIAEQHIDTRARLAMALLRLDRTLGVEGKPGTRLLPGLTHDLLADELATTREQVTLWMNSFRQENRVEYSRTGIRLWPGKLLEVVAR